MATALPHQSSHLFAADQEWGPNSVPPTAPSRSIPFDEQIVPALRKQLEKEQASIGRRISRIEDSEVGWAGAAQSQASHAVKNRGQRVQGGSELGGSAGESSHTVGGPGASRNATKQAEIPRIASSRRGPAAGTAPTRSPNGTQSTTAAPQPKARLAGLGQAPAEGFPTGVRDEEGHASGIPAWQQNGEVYPSAAYTLPEEEPAGVEARREYRLRTMSQPTPAFQAGSGKKATLRAKAEQANQYLHAQQPPSSEPRRQASSSRNGADPGTPTRSSTRIPRSVGHGRQGSFVKEREDRSPQVPRSSSDAMPPTAAASDQRLPSTPDRKDDFGPLGREHSTKREEARPQRSPSSPMVTTPTDWDEQIVPVVARRLQQQAWLEQDPRLSRFEGFIDTWDRNGLPLNANYDFVSQQRRQQEAREDGQREQSDPLRGRMRHQQSLPMLSEDRSKSSKTSDGREAAQMAHQQVDRAEYEQQQQWQWQQQQQQYYQHQQQQQEQSYHQRVDGNAAYARTYGQPNQHAPVSADALAQNQSPARPTPQQPKDDAGAGCCKCVIM